MIYVQIPNVSGDVTVKGYEGWHEAISYSFAGSRAALGTGTGASRSRDSLLRDFVVLFPSGKNTNQLALLAVSGRGLPTVSLVVLRAGKNSNEKILTLEMTNAFVASFSNRGNVDTLSFNYEKIAVKHTGVGPVPATKAPVQPKRRP